MLYNNVIAAEKPEDVVVEKLPDGSRRVILSRGFTELLEEEWTIWKGEQAAFLLEPDRTEGEEDIAAAFGDWWEYAAAYSQDDAAPTVEQRLESVETALLAMMEL